MTVPDLPEAPGKPGILDKIGIALAEHVLPKLVELLWPKLQEFFTKEVMPKMAGLVTLAVAAGLKELADRIPGFDMAEDAVNMAEGIRDRVNVTVPDFDIPILSNMFDLTDWWNKSD